MSAFKIYAKKGNKTMSIKIEEKHVYTHTFTSNSELAINVYKPNASTTADYVTGYGVNSNNIKVLHNSNNLTLQQGTAEDQRVGNKVNVKSISISLYIRFNTERLIAAFSHGQMIDTFFNFRVMTVRFNDPVSSADIARWYRESFIYYRTVSISGGDEYPYQSNWMDKLRESTEWTGSFEILYDKKFKIKKSKSVKQMNILVPLNGYVNFDNVSNKPTAGQKFNNVYTFLITPSNIFLDMDAVSSDKSQNMATDYTLLFYANANVKTIYYDM